MKSRKQQQGCLCKSAERSEIERVAAKPMSSLVVYLMDLIDDSFEWHAACGIWFSLVVAPALGCQELHLANGKA